MPRKGQAKYHWYTEEEKYSGHMSVVNLFIKYGADPRLCDSDGQIPLHKVTMKLLWFEMTVGQSDLR